MTRIAIATAPQRRSRHWTQSEIDWSEIAAWCESPAEVKEAGNYVLGTLRPTKVKHPGSSDSCQSLHRRKEAVVSRSAVALDVDHPGSTFTSDLKDKLGDLPVVWHTTFSSTPDAPRYRVLVLTDREMTPNEYVAVARVIMEDLGAAQFDAGSSQPERYMFRPAASDPTAFRHGSWDGEPLSVDAMLEAAGELPEDTAPPVSRNKRNPYEIAGVVGAFNRAYESFDDLIETYELPYTRDGADRWYYGAQVGEPGLVLLSEGLVFSHYAHDPAATGHSQSAFDLVRMHRFGELDANTRPATPVTKLPSYAEMCSLASRDERVQTEVLKSMDFEPITPEQDHGALNGARTTERTARRDSGGSGGGSGSGGDSGSGSGGSGDSGDWRRQLQRTPRSQQIIDNIHNWDLICSHDPVFGGLHFNELSFAIETHGPLPWRSNTVSMFTKMDRSSFALYLERRYQLKPTDKRLDQLIDAAAQGRVVNHVKDYLVRLPPWDGVPRVETCLPGVEPTPYSRMVARKSLVAAVARVFNPGVKWDHVLVVMGEEGLGKSHWINKLAQGWTASLGDISNKDTLLIMHRSWIMIADEGYSLKKSDADMLKEFLTRTTDTFRVPFERETGVYPRRCVIWSTTNDRVFLRSQEGNRRFLIVEATGSVDFEALTPEYIEQVWAEAIHLFMMGEPLFIAGDDAAMAAEVRDTFTEEDALIGLIQEYLATPVPEDWAERTPESRASWFASRGDEFTEPGTQLQDQVCSTQIWVEALGRRIGDHRRADLLLITNALDKLEDWGPVGRRVVPGYGQQRVFERKQL